MSFPIEVLTLTPRLPELDLERADLQRRTLTGTHLHTLHGCAHEVFLDFTVPRTDKLPASEAVQSLLSRGRAFEDDVIRNLEWVEPQYERGDFTVGAEETRRLMREGHSLIYQGVLADGSYLGIADLLRRVEEPSDFGAYRYEVIDIKSSRKAKLEQVMQVAFYSLLLGATQGATPTHGALWLRDAPEERFAIEDCVWTLLDQLDELRALLTREQPSRPHRSSRCDGCGWRTRCVPDMEAAGDLSLLPSVSRSRSARLRSAGIADLAQLAASNPQQLMRERVLTPVALLGLQAQAEAHLKNTAVRLADYATLQTEWKEQIGRVLLWSAEPDPFRPQQMWMLRAALFAPGATPLVWRQFFCDAVEESSALQELASWLQAHPSELAFHFGERQHATLTYAALHLHPKQNVFAKLLASSRDLRALWLAHLAHPVANATLYDLARWYGWRAEEEGGVAPALWWENARHSDDARWRERVLHSDALDVVTGARLLAELGLTLGTPDAAALEFVRD